MNWRKALDKLRGGRRTVERSPFYETHPYRGRCDIVSADKRGAIDCNLGVFYNRIPKAGNTTVIMNLAQLGQHAGQPARLTKKTFQRPSQLTRDQVVKLGTFFKFTVVRNPYTRLLSAYLDKVATGKKTISTRRNLPPPTFREFCRFLAEGGWWENAHWAPQTDLLLLPPEKLDYIGKLETFEESMSAVYTRLSRPQPEKPHFARYANHATGADGKTRQYYDDYCKSVIQKIYETDFVAFEYPSDL
jgi:hypothetical protein